MPYIAPEQVATVAVIGGGTIGAGWTAYFLSRGLHVVLVEPHVPQATLRRQIDTAASHLPQSPGIAGTLTLQRQIDEVLAGVEFVQESGPERLATKRAILQELEVHLPPNAVISSSTSSLLASDLQEGCRHPSRILVGHPFNPPHLLPLVEVVAGRQTAADAIAWSMAFYTHVGKRPVHVKKETVGHVANRLTAALLREAAYLIDQEVTTAEEIDTIMTHGPGLRWSLMGPFLTYHLAGGHGGIQHYMEHLGPTHEARWRTLGYPRLTPDLRQTIVQQVLEMVGAVSIDDLEHQRDSDLIRLLDLVSMKSSNRPNSD